MFLDLQYLAFLFQVLVLMMVLEVITRCSEQCWSLLISWMDLILEETSRFSWQQIGKRASLKSSIQGGSPFGLFIIKLMKVIKFVHSSSLDQTLLIQL